MQDVLDKFKTVEKKLKSKPWFKSGKWNISVHSFPTSKPEFVTFHVSKKHWFNENRQGIHFESYLAIDPKNRKKSSVTLHLLHEPIIPGTKIKRIELSKLVVDAIREKVEEWEGYEFRAGAYGVQPFTKKLDGTSKDFEKVVEAEIARLCQGVGGAVDKALKSLLG